MQCIRCDLLLQMSHIAWSVCPSVSVCSVRCAKTAELIEMPFGCLTHVGSTNHTLDGGSDSPAGRGTFEGYVCRPIVTYLSMSALHVDHLLPLANVPAQHTWRMNALTATRGDKTAMRPFAKLLWTHVR